MRFLPRHCPQFIATASIIEKKEDLNPQIQKALRHRLDAHLWCLAWDSYAMAGTILDQFPFKSAMAHKSVVMEIAVASSTEKRGPILGMLYDEIARCARAVYFSSFALWLCGLLGRSGRTAPHNVGQGSTFACIWANTLKTSFGGRGHSMTRCLASLVF